MFVYLIKYEYDNGAVIYSHQGAIFVSKEKLTIGEVKEKFLTSAYNDFAKGHDDLITIKSIKYMTEDTIFYAV